MKTRLSVQEMLNTMKLRSPAPVAARLAYLKAKQAQHAKVQAA